MKLAHKRTPYFRRKLIEDVGFMVMMYIAFYLLSTHPTPNNLFVFLMFPLFTLAAILPFANTYLRMRNYQRRLIFKPSS